MIDIEHEGAELTEIDVSRWQPYPEYKHTGVEWLGEIPTHWDITRLGYISSVIDPQPDHRAPALAVSGGFPYIGIRDVNADGTVNVETARKIEEYAIIAQEERFRIDEKDIVFCKVGTLGLPRHIKPEGQRIALSATLVLIKASGQTLSEFLFYMLDSNAIYAQIDLMSTGSTRSALGIEQIRKFSVLLPTLPEQHAIAIFLDRETAKIDALIAKKRKLITLLHEQRSAIISHAVTKGLNPDVPMKDSGIEWLGEIPVGWKTVKIKYIAALGNGSTPLKENSEYWKDGDYPWLTSTVVNGEIVSQPTEFVTPVALRDCHLPIVESGSVLIAITGQGKTRGMVSLLPYEATINQHLVYITPQIKSLDPRFLQYFLSSIYEILVLTRFGGG